MKAKPRFTDEDVQGLAGEVIQTSRGECRVTADGYGVSVRDLDGNWGAFVSAYSLDVHQAVADKLRGVTRYPRDPRYIIKPFGDDTVRVMNEDTWTVTTVNRSYRRLLPSAAATRAAHWYFEEGPGRRKPPLEGVQSGEVWRLTVDGEEGTYLVRVPIASPGLRFVGTASGFAVDNARITAGRKLLEADGSVFDGQD